MSIPSNPKITALVITYNEIGFIDSCLNSIGFTDEIIVVDSYSTDGTYEYLKSRSDVKVVQHKFENFTHQKSFALGLAKNDWILFLDADEVIPEALGKEILSTIAQPNPAAAYWVYREFMFKNKRLRFSGWQTDRNYRLFRRSRAKFTATRLVHETLEVNGISDTLHEKLIHYSYKNYQDYRGKMLHYGRLKAKEDFLNGKRYPTLLLWVKPIWKFLNHYIIRLGFLDGKKGLIICHLNALGVLERCRTLRSLNR